MSGFFRKHWRKIVLVILSIPVVGYFAICISIGFGVRNAVSGAQEQFPGDPVTALIALATSEETSISDRNRAIWALGQLGSAEALPTLRSLETHQLCDHDSLICQHEVESAIKGCSGGTNAGAWVWRHGELAVGGEN